MESEQTNEINAALSKAQGEIVPPVKTKTAKMGSYSYKYADLADVIESLKGPLSKNNLSYTQQLKSAGDLMIIRTTLRHSSGQWISSEMPMPKTSKPQDQAAYLTYYRRYSLTALCGCAAEDDNDGAEAQADSKKSKLNDKYGGKNGKAAIANHDSDRTLDSKGQGRKPEGGQQAEAIGNTDSFDKDFDL